MVKNGLKMQDYQLQFIEFLCQRGVLQFGDFTLKSGRQSPYFFNLGLFNRGESLMRLGQFYAAALEDSLFQYDMLFGPAYKGIPLVSTTAIALYTNYNKDVPYCFNRKEKKLHGDQGNFVGATLTGKVVMIDDVITAGTTIRETVEMMANLPVTLSGILIAFDRQERGNKEQSAVKEAMQTYQIPIHSIININHVLQYLENKPEWQQQSDAIRIYQAEYGVRE